MGLTVFKLIGIASNAATHRTNIALLLLHVPVVHTPSIARFIYYPRDSRPQLPQELGAGAKVGSIIQYNTPQNKIPYNTARSIIPYDSYDTFDIHGQASPAFKCNL